MLVGPLKEIPMKSVLMTLTFFFASPVLAAQILICDVQKTSGRFEGVETLTVKIGTQPDSSAMQINLEIQGGDQRELIKIRPEKLKQRNGNLEVYDNKMDTSIYFTLNADGSGRLLEKGDVIGGLGKLGELFADSSQIRFANCREN